jgi:hypothetical protein
MIPLITDDLLDYLQAAFPNQLPEHPCSLDQLAALQGQQRVIAFLRHRQKQQNILTSGN